MQNTEPIPILLVDDSEEQRRKVRGLLAARPGLAIEEADNGREALERAAAEEFDCILLDVRMPGLDGFDVAEALRKGGRAAFVPIIFLTGAPAPDRYLKRGYALGAVDFASYPLIPEVFLAKLEVFLQLSRKARALDRYAASLEEQVRERTAELEYRSRLTRTLTEHAASGLFLLDDAGRATFMNPAASRITGFPRDGAAGMPLPEILRCADPRSLTALNLSEALARPGRTRQVEGAFLRRDGSVYHGLCTVTGLDLEDGRRGAVAELQDITERKLAERALREKEEKLHRARRMEAVGRLAGGIAHDFSNILAAIDGYGALCQGMVEPGGPLHENLAEIRAAGGRASSLVARLLAFARRQVMAPKLVDLNACVSESVLALAALAGGGIRLNLDLDPALGPVRSDPEWIRQILIILVRNARDAMPEGGLIRIGTARVAVPEGEAGPARPGRFSMLSVGDNGTGMDPAVKARIFEPFFTTKGIGRGAGMGLAMADGIVCQCGGHIEVDSEVGRGTTLRLYFPEAGLLAMEEGPPESGRAIPDLPERARQPEIGAGLSGAD
jgi:PAS domain S-box-containing protein